MAKLDATIVAVLNLFVRPIHRTKLVKLIYLIDEIYHQHFGHTLTGLQYEWDHYGPNAVSDAIVKEADHLAAKNIIHITPQPNNMYGKTSYLYKLEKDASPYMDDLSPVETYIIEDKTMQYKHYNIPKITKVSKETDPFRTAKQYEVLHMKKSKEYEELVRQLESDSKGLNKAIAAI